MALPHSPGRASDLSAMADSDHTSHTGTSKHRKTPSLLDKLVAGKNPFSKSARKLHDPVSVPPRSTSLADEDTNVAHTPRPLTDKSGDHRTATTNSSRSSLEPVSGTIPAVTGAAEPQSPAATPASASVLSPLDQQRQELVARVVEEARKNKKAPLSEEGRRHFEQAGFGHLVDKQSDVEVETHWLKPVIQETIIRKIHTEYQTVIDRHIHVHHVYPRIQPIHDPDPIMLQPRHRMFSPRTGHWHEVIGDAEAISLLGEDAFLNGPKQYREIRRAALPGLDSSYEDQPDEIKYAGPARIIERETVEGGPTGHWQTIKGKFSSREGAEDDVHLIDGLEGLGQGVRTMHVSI